MNDKDVTRACSMLIVGPPKQAKSPIMAAALEKFRGIFGDSITVDVVASIDGRYDIERLGQGLRRLPKRLADVLKRRGYVLMSLP